MPELPEVQALAEFLNTHAVGAVIGRVDVAAVSVLKTFDPPVTAIQGRDITGTGRWGKHLGINCGGIWLVTHLARAGWLRWSDNPSPQPPKPGAGPLAIRVHLFTPQAQTPAFDLTEAGTKKGLAVWVTQDPNTIPSISRLGPDVLAVSSAEFAAQLKSVSARIKNAITDQRVVAGIGNAYSDEILHAARISPYSLTSKLTAEQFSELYSCTQSVLADAIARSVGQEAARLKQEKRSGLRVHARTGEKCPLCGDVIREVSFAAKSFQYCATCQTGGKPLADRRMSRLLR